MYPSISNLVCDIAIALQKSCLSSIGQSPITFSTKQSEIYLCTINIKPNVCVYVTKYL